VRPELQRREAAEAVLDSRDVVRVEAERDPDRVAGMVDEQAAPRSVALDDAESGRVAGHTVMELFAQALAGRLGLVGRGLAVAARREGGDEEGERPE
jgi:hypothetical protein